MGQLQILILICRALLVLIQYTVRRFDILDSENREVRRRLLWHIWFSTYDVSDLLRWKDMRRQCSRQTCLQSSCYSELSGCTFFGEQSGAPVLVEDTDGQSCHSKTLALASMHIIEVSRKLTRIPRLAIFKTSDGISAVGLSCDHSVSQ